MRVAVARRPGGSWPACRRPPGISCGRRPPAAPAAPASSATNMPATPQPVVIFDVMDTLVHDPFYKHMPAYFDLSFKELLEAKHPTAWIEFERGAIDEQQFLSRFFADGRAFDGPGLVQHMVAAYRYIDGMPELLQRLRGAGVEMHVMSNYPTWYRYIEEKLGVSQYLPWTFVSCEGPMQGLRKPAAEAFQVVKDTLAVAPGQRLVLVDDRLANVEGAVAAGMGGVHFKGSSAALEQQLQDLGIRF